jgi:hypothetical protein
VKKIERGKLIEPRWREAVLFYSCCLQRERERERERPLKFLINGFVLVDITGRQRRNLISSKKKIVRLKGKEKIGTSFGFLTNL